MLNRALGQFFIKYPVPQKYETIWKLAQVDFKKRYNESRLGLFWAFLNPVLQTIIYYLAFTFFLSKSREGIENFAMFLFSATIFWTFFREIVGRSLNIFINKAYLIENLQFNKFNLFLSSSLVSFIGIAFNLTGYLLSSVLFSIEISFAKLMVLPLVLLALFLIAIGCGMIVSVVNIFYRDIKHLLEFFFKFGFWTSGILFPVEKVIEVVPVFYFLNPIIGIIKNVRNILVFNQEIDYVILSLNLVIGVILFAIGRYLVDKNSALVLEYK